MASTSEGYNGLVNDDGLSSFTIVCGGVISGGAWVKATSGANADSLSLSGGNAVWDDNYIIGEVGASGTTRPIGMAVQNAGSNTDVAVIRRGLVICPVNGTVTAGANVAASSDGSTCYGCVANAATGSPAFNTQDVIGIALVSATSGTTYFTIVELNL